MIVVDASAVVELLGLSPSGEKILDRIENQSVNAPHLLDVEVVNVLRRQRALGAASTERADQALLDFLLLRIVRHAHTPLLPRIWELRSNFTAYDACYLALAEELEATLLTRDSAMGTARLRRGRVEII